MTSVFALRRILSPCLSVQSPRVIQSQSTAIILQGIQVWKLQDSAGQYNKGEHECGDDNARAQRESRPNKPRLGIVANITERAGWWQFDEIAHAARMWTLQAGRPNPQVPRHEGVSCASDCGMLTEERSKV